jgi:multimeric flavodoxin WrbA
MMHSRRLLILVGSPRREGNSATLARAVQRGAAAAGSLVALRFVDDFISSFLRDCRTCRLPDGQCSIADRFRALFFEDFIPAGAVVFCSPIYWYGLSAQTKAFFDRTFLLLRGFSSGLGSRPRRYVRKTHRPGLNLRGDLPGSVARHHPPDSGVLSLHEIRVRGSGQRHRQQPWRG